jgi:hypothetical protein
MIDICDEKILEVIIELELFEIIISLLKEIP